MTACFFVIVMNLTTCIFSHRGAKAGNTEPGTAMRQAAETHDRIFRFVRSERAADNTVPANKE